MAIYLKDFNNVNEYDEYIVTKISSVYDSGTTNNDDFLPNTSLIDETDVRFNPYKFEDEYFSFRILDDSNYIKYVATDENFIDYKKNDGEWTSQNTSTLQIPVNYGDIIRFKGNSSDYRGCSFSGTTCRFEVEGNIMSLNYNNNFRNQTEPPENIYYFDGLFQNCTGLTSSKNLVLPGQRSYNSMFLNCTLLKKAPKIIGNSATTIPISACTNMFAGCTSLVNTPELPVINLSDNCYQYMFQGCTSLVNAPELASTTLTNNCYEGMFANCTGLTNGPSSIGNSATTMAASACSYMFSGCTSLVNAPELPVTTLANRCYANMFFGCTSLTTAPELPATTLAPYCYSWMFYGCSSLVNAPELPATQLKDYCYQYMFNSCTGLTQQTVPILSGATTFAKGCYSHIFAGISRGSNKVLPDTSHIDFSASTVVASGVCIGLFAGTRVTNSDLLSILPSRTEGGIRVTILPVTALTDSCYSSMFSDCTSLTTAPILPATKLASSCYENMFSLCSSLVNAPKLPATTLANFCYSRMFSSCRSLVNAPKLPATQLKQYCYQNMFSDCSSLVNAPELPATTLADRCYSYMFYGCTSLVTAPELPATTLANSCYQYMFNGCSKLNYIKCLATDKSAFNCTYNWVNGVASTGTFYKNSNISTSTWGRGASGIPSGWSVYSAT